MVYEIVLGPKIMEGHLNWLQLVDKMVFLYGKLNILMNKFKL